MKEKLRKELLNRIFDLGSENYSVSWFYGPCTKMPTNQGTQAYDLANLYESVTGEKLNYEFVYDKAYKLRKTTLNSPKRLPDQESQWKFFDIEKKKFFKELGL